MPPSEKANAPEYQALAPSCKWSHLCPVPSHLEYIRAHRSAKGEEALSLSPRPRGFKEGKGLERGSISLSFARASSFRTGSWKPGGGREKPGSQRHPYSLVMSHSQHLLGQTAHRTYVSHCWSCSGCPEVQQGRCCGV